MKMRKCWDQAGCVEAGLQSVTFTPVRRKTSRKPIRCVTCGQRSAEKKDRRDEYALRIQHAVSFRRAIDERGPNTIQGLPVLRSLFGNDPLLRPARNGPSLQATIPCTNDRVLLPGEYRRPEPRPPARANERVCPGRACQIVSVKRCAT